MKLADHLEIHIDEEKLDFEDQQAFRDHWHHTFDRVNDILRLIKLAVNNNDGSAICADALPDPAKEYEGRFVCVLGATDVLHWCRSDGAGGYEWKIVTLT